MGFNNNNNNNDSSSSNNNGNGNINSRNGSLSFIPSPPQSISTEQQQWKKLAGRANRLNVRIAFLFPVVLLLVCLNVRGVSLVGEESSTVVTSENQEMFAPDRGVLDVDYSYNSNIDDATNSAMSNNRTDVLLPIFWLNNGADTNARTTMEGYFRSLKLHSNDKQSLWERRLIQRIPIWSVQETKNDYYLHPSSPDRRLLLENNATLKEESQRPKKLWGQYTFEDGARLITHLSIIKKALIDGWEQILILEDNAILTQDFFDHWQQYASLAPSDWTVLQWGCSNIPHLEQTYSIPEAWLSWLPDLGGAHAYLISRQGMQSIRRMLMKEHRGNTVFRIGPEFPKVLLADEILFSTDQRAYTSTYPWVLTQSTVKALDKTKPLGSRFTTSPPNLPKPIFTKPARNESVLVFMNIRIATTKRMLLELDRLKTDNEALCGVHEHSSSSLSSRCQWIVRVVLAAKHMIGRFEEYRHLVPSNMELHISATQERFNKFSLLAENLRNMSQYDLVVIKDNDQRIAGFPWASFLERKGNALVAGPLRQTLDESYGVTKLWEKRQHYKFHDAHAWKMRSIQPWSTDLFVATSVLEVPFLEMYFNVFDGAYAQWFFSQVLTKNFTEQDSCWGPDFLWCPAAKEYAPERIGCALVPYVSVHEDTRQITKDGEAFNLRGYAAVDNMRTNPKFDEWYKIASAYAQGVIAWRQLDAIAKHCRLKVLGDRRNVPLDFRNCVHVALVKANVTQIW